MPYTSKTQRHLLMTFILSILFCITLHWFFLLLLFIVFISTVFNKPSTLSIYTISAICGLLVGIFWVANEYIIGKNIQEIHGRITKVYKHGIVISSPHGKYFLPTYDSYTTGDSVVVQNYTTTSTRNTRNSFLLKDTVFYSLIIRTFDIRIIPGSEGPVSRMKESIAQVYRKTLGPPYDGLVMGFLFGGDELIPEQYQDMFRTTGTSHILVVSGFNVAFMIVLMGFLVKKVTYKKYLRYIFSLFAIFGYLMFTGIEASILRASVIAILFLTSYFLSRHTSFMNALLILLAGLAIHNPYMILFDIGLQLSVVATIGIVYGSSLSDFFFDGIKNNILKQLLQAFALTFIAYAITFPIIHYYFHATMVISPIINLLIAPLIPLVMVLGISLIPLSLISPLANLVAYVIMSMLRLLLYIIEHASHQTQFIFHYQFTLTHVFAYFLSLITSFYFLLCIQNHKNKKYFLPRSLLS